MGLGGWGPPLVYCHKQDRGDLVPVDRVKNKRGSTAVKKPQQNHTLDQSGSGAFSRRRPGRPNVSGGMCGRRKQSRWRSYWLPTALLFVTFQFPKVFMSQRELVAARLKKPRPDQTRGVGEAGVTHLYLAGPSSPPTNTQVPVQTFAGPRSLPQHIDGVRESTTC